MHSFEASGSDAGEVEGGQLEMADICHLST